MYTHNYTVALNFILISTMYIWKCEQCIFLFLSFLCPPLFAYHSHMFVTVCLFNVER